MASIIKYTVGEPILTGSLLWILTQGSPELRSKVLQPLASLPFQVEPQTLVTGLKVLFGLGVVSRLNSWATTFAKNNWKFNTGAKAWNWPSEIIVITGGSGGIGSRVGQRLAETGMKVVIMDPMPPPDNLKALKNVYHYECDITDAESVEKVAEKIQAEVGNPTILFNNAGIGKTFTILDVPSSFLDKIFKINLLSHWYTTRAFLPAMIAGKKGHVVATASMASFINAAGMVDYCVTKAGVMSFQEGLQQELKHRYNAPFVKVTTIHPYWVNTNLVKDWTQKGLAKRREVLLDPDYVADQITKAILSGQSQQVLMPTWMSIAASLRAFPLWLQELVRDSTEQTTAH